MHNITIEQEIIRGIPLLRFLPQKAKAAPVVFYVHGFGGSKETGGEIGLRLAQRGIACVAVDAPDHGDRPHDRIDQIFQPDYQPIYPMETGFDVYSLMLDQILEMTAEIDSLVDELAADPRLDMRRAGITGLSYGGMVAFQVAATSQRIQAAVPMISMPTSLERWEDLVTEASSYSQWAEAMTAARGEVKKRAEWLRQYEALPHLKNFAPRPLLILCGDQDTDMPKVYAVRAVRELLPVYHEHPERLTLTINDGVAHRVTIQMMEDMAAWFQKYL
jgi:uncharacterized protein